MTRPTPLVLDDILNIAPRCEWGPWRFYAGGLKNEPMDYLIGWDRFPNTAAVLGWILHMAGKNPDLYGGDANVAGLVAALNEVLCLYLSQDPSGRSGNVRLDAPALAAAHKEKLRAAGLWPAPRRSHRRGST